MANLINVNVSSKENLNPSSPKKGDSLLSKKLDNSKTPFAITLDKALKVNNKNFSLKGKNDSLKQENKNLSSLKEDSSRSIKNKLKESNSLVDQKLKSDTKVDNKNLEKTNVDHIILLGNNSSQLAKNSLPLDKEVTILNSVKNKTAENDKVIFSSKGHSIEVSIENLRKKDTASNKIQSLRAQNSFQKEEKSIAVKSDLVLQGDLKVPTLVNSSFSSSGSEISRRESLNFNSQFWQEWEAKIDSQIIDKARIILKDGNAGEIQLKLYPEKLGTVRVSLDIEGSQVLARFVLDNPQLKEVFEANSVFLQKGLEESGLSVSLNFSSFSGEDFKGSEESLEYNKDSNLTLASNGEIEILEAELSENAQALIDMVI